MSELALTRPASDEPAVSRTDSLPLTVAWFETATPDGPAYGDPETTTWGNIVGIIAGSRREGDKDGCNVVPSRFRLEPGGRRVRRKLDRVEARAAVALDVETNAKTGEVPPLPTVTACRLQALGMAGIVYTSHSHHPEHDIRYRVALPLEAEVPPDLPAPQIVGDRLGLAGVLDRSKFNAASLFYLPSCPYGALDLHQTIVIPGAPIGEWLLDAAAVRKAEEDRIAAEASQAAADRLAAKIAAGFNPSDSLIEKIRSRYNLADVLTAHGYDRTKAGAFRHPASQSGCFGASIKTFGGIDRVYSHNAGDPLHHSNLPSWCTVRAVDVFDAVVILDFGGDRDRALRELAERFNLSKAPARKAVAATIYRRVRQRADQEAIESAAYTSGYLNGLSRAEVIAVAKWVASQLAVAGRAA
jgi:hypothetical protein